LGSGAYDLCSLLRLIPPEEWRAEHRTARKRADRAGRRGYRFAPIRRHERAEEIWAINTSAEWRQGRRMAPNYAERPSSTPDPDYLCPRHAVRSYGVEDAGGTLVAYLHLYRAGELALVSQVLGHAEHLEREVMWLLFAGVIAAEHELEPTGWLVYNRHDSGTDGLRFFKERIGFTEHHVEWEL
jgi:hypothetical protein